LVLRMDILTDTNNRPITWIYIVGVNF
jgi:hypothetical protein